MSNASWEQAGQLLETMKDYKLPEEHHIVYALVRGNAKEADWFQFTEYLDKRKVYGPLAPEPDGQLEGYVAEPGSSLGLCISFLVRHTVRQWGHATIMA